MLKHAYHQGVLRAYADAGLVKEAGVPWEVTKAIGRGLRDKIKASVSAIKSGVRHRQNAITDLKAAATTDAANQARTAILRGNRHTIDAAKPWFYTGGILGGSGAAGYGAYQGAKKLFPKAFDDEE